MRHVAMRPIATIGRLRGVYYGWWLLAGATLVMAVTGGLSFWAFGLYIGPLEDDFGWSRSEVSLGFSISLLASGIVAPFVGRWVDRHGPRRMFLLGASATVVTFLLLALTSNLWQWFLLQALAGVARQMVHLIPLSALIARWFQRRRGLAMGVLASGFMAGGFTLVPLLRVIIDEGGWDVAFIFSGLFTLVLYLPLGLFVLRDSPGDDRTERPLDRPADEDAALEGVTLRVALRTPLFWLITMSITLLYFGLFGWQVHMVPYFESVGLSAGWAVGIVSIGAVGGVFTRLLFGIITDRMRSVEMAAMGLTIALLVALLALYVGEGTAVAVGIFTFFWAIGTGGGPMIDPLLVVRGFGQRHFATILGAIATVWTLGMLISPSLVAAIFDSSGSYDWAIVVLMGAFAGSFLSFGLAGRAARPIEQVALLESPVAGG